MAQLKQDRLWDDTRRNFEDNSNYVYGEWRGDLEEFVDFVESNKEFFSVYCQGGDGE
jgi:hypothetical protein